MGWLKWEIFQGGAGPGVEVCVVDWWLCGRREASGVLYAVCAVCRRCD